jgi:hypothetical protein
LEEDQELLDNSNTLMLPRVSVKNPAILKPTKHTPLFVEGVGTATVQEMADRISQILATIANGLQIEDDDAIVYLQESMSKGSELFKLVEGLNAAKQFISSKRNSV